MNSSEKPNGNPKDAVGRTKPALTRIPLNVLTLLALAMEEGRP